MSLYNAACHNYNSIKTRYNETNNKVSANHEESTFFANYDKLVIDYITNPLLVNIDEFKTLINNAINKCENFGYFNNTKNDLNNLLGWVTEMYEVFSNFQTDIYNCSREAYNEKKAEYLSKNIQCIFKNEFCKRKKNRIDNGEYGSDYSDDAYQTAVNSFNSAVDDLYGLVTTLEEFCNDRLQKCENTSV